MSQYESMITRQRKWMLYLLAIFVLGAGFSSYPNVFNGLLLGGAISFYNLWVLQRKIARFGETVAKGGSTLGIGTFTRLAGAALAVMIALKFDAIFDMIGVVFGLGTSYIVLMMDFAFRTFSQKDQ